MDRQAAASDRRGFLVLAARLAAATGVAAGSLHLMTRPGAVAAAPCGLPQTCPKCAVRAGCAYLATEPAADEGRK